MDWKEISHDLRNLEVPSSASKMITGPLVHSAQTVHLSCIKIWTESSFHLCLVTRSTIRCIKNDFWAYGTFGANRAPILHWHCKCLQTDRNEIPHDPHHLGVPSGASKMISEPMVCSAQTVHLSCIKISTVYKQTQSSFHLSLIT
jgi:hypothetical protein